MTPWQSVISSRCRGRQRKTFDRVRIAQSRARPRIDWNSLVAVIRMPMSPHVGGVDLGNSK
jgi:hypothetical protein